MLGLQRANVPR